MYELPFGRGKKFGGDILRALDYVIGGIQLNAIFRAQSGNPFDVRFNNALVNVSGDPYTGQTTPYLRFGAFSTPVSGIGNLARNSLRSPSTRQLNLGLTKNFGITERAKIQFRAEAFNVFNSIQYAIPSTNLSDTFINNNGFTTSFGYISGTSPYSNRQLQFGLRLEF